MKFTLPKSLITEIATTVGRLLSNKTSIPILKGILVEVKKDCILFTASNGTESMIHRQPVTEEVGILVEVEGSSVFTKETLDITKKMKGDITFEVDDTTVTVSQNKTALEFPVALASEYPKIDIQNTKKAISFEGKDFEKMLKKTIYATSQSMARPILTGVHMELGAVNRFVATDSHRLARYESGSSQEEINITVPASILEYALKTFDLTQTILVFPSSNQISLVNGKTIINSSLLEGNFPETDRLIPSEFHHELIMNKDELIGTLELLSVLTDKGVIQLTVNGLSLEITAKGGTSKGKQELFYESYEGTEGFQISVSALYMLEAIRTITTDSVKLSFVEKMRPFVITPVSNDAIAELQLILPVRSY